MPAAGARPKEAKINLMDCSCLCREVEYFACLRCLALLCMTPAPGHIGQAQNIMWRNENRPEL